MTTTPLLETRGVWQRFGGLIANSDVSISVGRGEKACRFCDRAGEAAVKNTNATRTYDQLISCLHARRHPIVQKVRW